MEQNPSSFLNAMFNTNLGFNQSITCQVFIGSSLGITVYSVYLFLLKTI